MEIDLDDVKLGKIGKFLFQYSTIFQDILYLVPPNENPITKINTNILSKKFFKLRCTPLHPLQILKRQLTDLRMELCLLHSNLSLQIWQTHVWKRRRSTVKIEIQSKERRRNAQADTTEFSELLDPRIVSSKNQSLTFRIGQPFKTSIVSSIIFFRGDDPTQSTFKKIKKKPVNHNFHNSSVLNSNSKNKKILLSAMKTQKKCNRFHPFSGNATTCVTGTHCSNLLALSKQKLR